MKKYILYIVAILAGTSVSAPVFAETMKNKINIKPSMTLDVPVSSINLNLDPATNAFASEDVNITVGTNNKTGYWISMSSATSGSDLVNIDDNTKTIPTITTAGSYTSSDFPINQWGYKIDSGNYTPFVSGATIKSSNTAANGEMFKLNIASKIDYLQPSGTYNIALNIKMLPNMIQEYMQDITPEMCTEEPSVVMDKRDGQTYTIARLKDGKCWMTQNLRLGSSSYTEPLTTANTNMSPTVEFTLPTSMSTDFSKVTSPMINTEYANASATSYGFSDGKIGVYYNYCAASAGTYCDATTPGGNAEYDICPAEWRLPAGSEYQSLIDVYASNYEDFMAAFSIVLSGGFHASSPYSQSTQFAIWSSTYYDGIHMKYLLVSPNNQNKKFEVAAYNYRGNGFAVRCLLKES